MNSDTTFSTSTDGSVGTHRLAQRLARNLKGGEVIELTGDLGSGKTTFVKGLAAALGFDGEVTSPTFTLSRVYPITNDRQLYHFDLYRLQGHDIVSDELTEAMGDPAGITAIEWAGQDGTALPPRRLVINFRADPDPQRRTITIRAQDPSLAYALKGLAA